MVDISDIEEPTKLERVQSLDANELGRRDVLGKSFDFEETIPPAQEVIHFFRQFPTHLLFELSDDLRQQIEGQAGGFVSLVDQILEFDPAAPNATVTRDSLIQQVRDYRRQAFNSLYPIVSYLATRQNDFTDIERRAREAADAAAEEVKRMKEELQQGDAEAKRILAQLRATAAELGVSQEAIHFGTEATAHETAASNWQKYTVRIALGLGAYAVLSLILGHYVLVPSTPYEAFQLGLSKVLIFATIAFMLFLSARTLMAHRHNRIVNKHRQNALLTFNALVEATHSDEARDIVLTHASACIFSPQESGFTKGQPSGQTLVEMMPRISAASGHSVG